MGYLKTNRFFCPDLGKKGPIWPLDRVFWIFWKILSLVFLGNNLKRKLILLLIFHDQSHIWQNFGSLVMGQNTFSQSNCRINVISQEKSLLQVDTQSFWVCESRHAQRTQNKKFTYLCNISRKAWGVDFLPANKHEDFLQVDKIILGLHSQASPKYPKQQVYNILVISQGKREEWTWSFTYR